MIVFEIIICPINNNKIIPKQKNNFPTKRNVKLQVLITKLVCLDIFCCNTSPAVLITPALQPGLLVRAEGASSDNMMDNEGLPALPDDHSILLYFLLKLR